MKITQVSAITYQNKRKHPQKTYYSNSTLSYQGLTHSVAFKSRLNDFGNDMLLKAQKTIRKVNDSVRKAYDSVMSFLESNPTEKRTKHAYKSSPVTTTIGGSAILPQPEFTINYKKILTELEKPEKVDAKWVKSNKEIINATPNSDPSANMNNYYYRILSGDINSDRDGWIKMVKEYQAQEHKAYIDSIRKEFIDIDPTENKEKSLLGLKALQKYGSHDDLALLKRYNYNITKDDDIMREYAKFVGKVGETKDIITLRSMINEESLDIYSEKTFEVLMKVIKDIMSKAPENHYKNFSYTKYRDFEMFSEKFKDNSIIKENAKAIMRRIEADNPEYRP